MSRYPQCANRRAADDALAKTAIEAQRSAVKFTKLQLHAGFRQCTPVLRQELRQVLLARVTQQLSKHSHHSFILEAKNAPVLRQELRQVLLAGLTQQHRNNNLA
jgi:hypothetical protein